MKRREFLWGGAVLTAGAALAGGAAVFGPGLVAGGHEPDLRRHGCWLPERPSADDLRYAVVTFQRLMGLPSSGDVDAGTLAALQGPARPLPLDADADLALDRDRGVLVVRTPTGPVAVAAASAGAGRLQLGGRSVERDTPSGRFTFAHLDGLPTAAPVVGVSLARAAEFLPGLWMGGVDSLPAGGTDGDVALPQAAWQFVLSQAKPDAALRLVIR